MTIEAERKIAKMFWIKRLKNWQKNTKLINEEKVSEKYYKNYLREKLDTFECLVIDSLF